MFCSRAPDDIARRVLSHVLIGDDCWEWTGWTWHGYGRIGIARRDFQAHRVVYELLVGPIPEGLDLDHLCHNADPGCVGGFSCPHRRCVNPAHLEPVTRQVNSKRGRTGQVTGARLNAWHRAKTHCPHGHPYDEENTYVMPGSNGWRVCRRCTYLSHRVARERKRAQVTNDGGQRGR